jgi:hypothetical protein
MEDNSSDVLVWRKMVHHRRKTKTQRGIRKKSASGGNQPYSGETESADNVEKEIRNVDEHPIDIGNYLIVRYRDNSQRIAKVRKSMM